MSDAPMPRVAAVIVTYRRREVLERTVAAVINQSCPPALTIVVDNAADPDVEVALSSRFPTVVYLPSQSNDGYGAGLAIGMAHAQAILDPDWYWLLDDDTPPAVDDLVAALAVAADHPSADVIANRGGHVRRGRIKHDLHEPEVVSTADFTLVDGTFVSRRAVAAAGLPRSDLFMMHEDFEYTTRINAAAGDLVVRPSEVTALHLGSTSSWRAYYQTRNHLRIVIERRSPSLAVGWALRTGRQCTVELWKRRWRLPLVRLLGTVDAIRGRMGRREDVEAWATGARREQLCER